MKLTKQRLTQIIKEELENLSEDEVDFEVEDKLTGLGKYKTNLDSLNRFAQDVFNELPEEAKSKAVFKTTDKWHGVVTGVTGAWNYSKFNFEDGEFHLDAPSKKGSWSWKTYKIKDPKEVAEIIADRIE